MKKILVGALVVVLMFAATGYVTAGSGRTSDKGFVIGTAVEFSTHVMKDLPDEEQIATMKFRAGIGFPVGIIEEETGKMFLCVYKNPAPASGLETANHILAEYMGMKVVVQGIKYQLNGIEVIRVSNVGEY